MYANNNNHYYLAPHPMAHPMAHPMGPWHNGSQKPDLNFRRYLSEMTNETSRHDEQISSLEREIEELQLQKKKLEEKSKEVATCEKMFALWGGVEIEESSESKCRVTFCIVYKGKDCGRYTIGFNKFGQFWTVSYYTLPPCMKLIPQKIEAARIDTIDKLSSMIRDLRLEADLFVRRQEQFKEAQTLQSSSLRIYPSRSTTSVLLEFRVDDNKRASDMKSAPLQSASVYLTYRTEKFLPEEPMFKFQGGDLNDHNEFKEQLQYLELVPLKQALQNAFSLDFSEAESQISMDVDNNTTSAEKGPNALSEPQISLDESNQSSQLSPVKSDQLQSQEESEKSKLAKMSTTGRSQSVRQDSKRGKGRGKRGTRGMSRGKK